MYVCMYQDFKLMYICMYVYLYNDFWYYVFNLLYVIKGTEMTLGESKAAFSALLNYGLLWPGSFILLKDPSISRYTEEYIEVNDVCMSECCCV